MSAVSDFLNTLFMSPGSLDADALRFGADQLEAHAVRLRLLACMRTDSCTCDDCLRACRSVRRAPALREPVAVFRVDDDDPGIPW